MFADLDDAQAHLVVDDLHVEDYHDVVNAILDGPSKAAEVSFKGAMARLPPQTPRAQRGATLRPARRPDVGDRGVGRPQRLGRLQVRPRRDVADRVRGAASSATAPTSPNRKGACLKGYGRAATTALPGTPPDVSELWSALSKTDVRDSNGFSRSRAHAFTVATKNDHN